MNQLSLPEDYEFQKYEDKGLSGYYSDRPDFQRLLRDIEMGKIRAVACYKLDRISRKTSDLMRLLEYFERHDVTLLVCSNNINTQISTSKIIIQVLAIIAEFERDILTERIQDNLMELAKDGRWLGGKTPTGFSSERLTTGSGKNKSAVSFLVPIPEERTLVQEIYRTFGETRSLLQTCTPHRKTNALLAGLMYCPVCGKRLRVISELNRWTNGKPRFKYVCPGVREKKCTFKAVEGVSLDEFVVQQLSKLNDQQNDYYKQIFENRISNMIRTEQSEQEYQETKKAVERLNTDIAAQVRNLREADEALRRFIQDDIKELTEELAKREAELRRMEDLQSENQYMLHELSDIKKRLLSFEDYAKDAQPETVFTLIHTIVERIYITTENNELKCQIYIKGCATEDYTNLFGAADYIDNNTVVTAVTFLPPMCDLDYYSICTEVQKTDNLRKDKSRYRKNSEGAL